MALLANPLAYVAINTIIPTIPSLAERLNLGEGLAGVFCSVWLFARTGGVRALVALAEMAIPVSLSGGRVCADGDWFLRNVVDARFVAAGFFPDGAGTGDWADLSLRAFLLHGCRRDERRAWRNSRSGYRAGELLRSGAGGLGLGIFSQTPGEWRLGGGIIVDGWTGSFVLDAVSEAVGEMKSDGTRPYYYDPHFSALIFVRKMGAKIYFGSDGHCDYLIWVASRFSLRNGSRRGAESAEKDNGKPASHFTE
jgi:hypothetical protein